MSFIIITFLAKPRLTNATQHSMISRKRIIINSITNFFRILMQNGIEWFYCKLYSSWDITIFPSSSRHCFQIRPWLLDRYNHKCSARPPEETGKARNVQIVLFRPFNVNEEWHWILLWKSPFSFEMKWFVCSYYTLFLQNNCMSGFRVYFYANICRLD